MAEYNITYDQLDALLQSLADNTPETPYEIEITTATADFFRGVQVSYLPLISGTLQYILRNNSTKYVSLTFGQAAEEILSIIESANYMLNCCRTLVHLDLSAMSSCRRAAEMLAECTHLKSVDVSGMSAVYWADGMFAYTAIESIDISGMVNIHSIDSLNYGLFQGCSSLETVILPTVLSVTGAKRTFENCTSLTEIDTSPFTNVTDTRDMFAGCSGLTEIDTSPFTHVINAHGMFAYCTGLTEIDTSPFTNVTNADFSVHNSGMFAGCTGLTEIDTFPFTHVIKADSMFFGCSGLAEIDISSMNSIENTRSMFENCTNLEIVNLPDLSSVTVAVEMFKHCASLEEIHGWSIPLTATMTDCFTNCDSLQAIYVPEVIPQESTWHAWEMSKDTVNSQTAVKVYNLDGTSVSVNVPSSGTYTTKVTDKVDELLFASAAGTITSAMIQKMLQIKAPITGRESILDPTKDNFVLWAKNQQEIKTNIVTNTVEANNPLPPSSAAVHAAISQIGLAMYPVGSIYMSVNSTDPKYIFGGDWEKLPDGVFIRNAGGNAGTVGQTQAEGLPNITGSWFGYTWDNGCPSGAITSSINNYNQVRSGDSNKNYVAYRFDAHESNQIYGNSSHVTPYNFCVYMWRRTA